MEAIRSSERHRQVGTRFGLLKQIGSRSRLWMTTPILPSYAGYRFPPAIIGHAVWLYFRFPLSLRVVEEILAERGIVVTHETVRRGAQKFGQGYANQSGADARGRRQVAPRRGRSSRSMAASTVSGGRSTRTATCSTYSCRPGATSRRPCASCGSCSRGCLRAAGDDHRQARELRRCDA